MARGSATNEAANAVQDQQRRTEQVTILAGGAPKEVDMSPPRGRSLESVRDLSAPVDPDELRAEAVNTAPVVGDATRARPQLPPNLAHRGMQHASFAPMSDDGHSREPPKPRIYRVEAERPIVDKTSQTRTKLREGKEISSQQYDIRDLQKQGVKLRDITDLDPNAPL